MSDETQYSELDPGEKYFIKEMLKLFRMALVFQAARDGQTTRDAGAELAEAIEHYEECYAATRGNRLDGAMRTPADKRLLFESCLCRALVIVETEQTGGVDVRA